MPAPRSWAERLKKPNLKNRTRSLPPRTSSQQALAQRRSGAKYVASSAPSHIRMPRVGALESPQRSKWWHSDMRCGQDKRKSAASPHQSEPRVCSLSVFLFLNKVTSSSAQLKKKHPKPMPVLAVSKVRKPEQRETRLKSQIETRPWAPSCCAIPSSLPRAGLVSTPAATNY